MGRIRTITFVCMLVTAASGFLYVRAGRADDATEARFHFQRGIELFKQGKTQLALEQFLLSNRLVKNANAVFNAAKCFEQLSKPNEAFALYSEYLQFDLEEIDRSEGELKLKEVEENVATIAIRSTPEGAEIFIDRKDLGSWGTTPRIVAVPPGSHEIIVELKNHHSLKVPIEAIKGVKKEVSVELEAKTTKVHFKSDHEKALITIDGKEEKNITLPSDLELPVGEHSLKIEVEGCVPEERAIEVKEGEANEVEFLLVPLPPPEGSLNIVSSPSSALVKVDGDEFGFTPLIKTAEAGKHSITVELAGRQSWKDEFKLSKDDSLFLTVDLVPEGIPKKHKKAQIAFWSVGGFFILSGMVTGSMAISTKEKFKEDSSVKLRNRGVFLNIATDGLMAAGALFVITGTVWYLLTRRAAKMKSKGEFSYEKAKIKEQTKTLD